MLPFFRATLVKQIKPFRTFFFITKQWKNTNSFVLQHRRFFHHLKISNLHHRKYTTKKTIEEIYQKKSPIQHVLDRPDTYVGSTSRITKNTWILNFENSTIIQKEISYVPALYRIVDELLVNAVDNHHRENTNTNILKVRLKENKLIFL